MRDDRMDWEHRLKEPPFMEPMFTEKLRTNVRRRLTESQRGPARSFRGIRGAGGLLAAFVCLGLVIFWSASAFQPAAPVPELRPSYYKDGNLLLQVFPDPELKAGRSYGYIFSFAELGFEAVNKTMAIEAVHLATGRRETVVKPYVLTPEVLAGISFARYTAFSAMPLEGYWRYEVLLDGELYADVILDVGEPSWEATGTFDAGSYKMTGIDGKVGFIDPGFVAGQPNKYMWHFWGNEEELDGRFEVLAVKQGSMELVPVFEADSLGGENNGANRHLPSSMILPEPGHWRLLPYVNGKLIDSIVVEVEKGT
ncbi:DUF4871 domain-containing protein [Paenibacillus nanensis]|uniref:DUF4871 domain-containing protein n=1 Tax=Paenibacillus nanensis TaxID=393251 RepID=A0A3A1UUQ2_9BACL|nr:DUF4871 domain-containing protein [Paenibacillus nanensis]RIX49993.1 DUF4871 domain-containing protein [Paenibacillus nanensis]